MIECSGVHDGLTKSGQALSLAIDTPGRTYFIKTETKELLDEWRKVSSLIQRLSLRLTQVVTHI